MLGDFIYSEEMENTSKNTDASYHNTPQKVEKTLKRLLLLAAIFACGGLIWIFAISPCMAPVKMDLSSFPGLSRSEILAIAGISSGATYIAINAEAAEHRLAAHYLVESAKVVKRFPDRLSIFLEPRKAVALTFAMVNGRTQPVYFDRYGVVFRIGSGGGETPPSWLPIVSGVLEGSRQPLLGMQLPAAMLPLFSRIGAISDEDPNIWKAISEISIARKSNDLYDLVLYPVHDSIRLRMGNDINKDSIYYALLMFDVSRQFGDAIPDEIDVRSGIGVFNAKEIHFGK